MIEKQHTSDTILEQFLKAKLVLDSQLYIAQAHILLDGNDHLDIWWPEGWTFQPWGEGKCKLNRHDRAVNRTFDILASFSDVCLLWQKSSIRKIRKHCKILTFGDGKEGDRKQHIPMCSPCNIREVARWHVHRMVFLMPCCNGDSSLVTSHDDGHKHCTMSWRVNRNQILR